MMFQPIGGDKDSGKPIVVVIPDPPLAANNRKMSKSLQVFSIALNKHSIIAKAWYFSFYMVQFVLMGVKLLIQLTFISVHPKDSNIH